MKILIASVQVPFTRGGAEILVDTLAKELKRAGHQVDVLTLPFLDQRKECLKAAIEGWRSLPEVDCDLVICTKFPTYFIRHPRKVLWLVHQHRQLFELLGTRFSDFHPNPESEALRVELMELEREALSECRLIAGISDNVVGRLERYMGITKALALPPPLPLGGKYKRGKRGNYVLSVGRLCSIKRVDLILKAFPTIHNGIRLKIVGLADEVNYEEYLRNEMAKHHLEQRVDFLGRVSDDELIELYANALCVYYGPYDEDYGFVTLEALESGKPVVTCSDSGGVLSYVKQGINGLIAAPETAAIARAVNMLVEDELLYPQLTVNVQRINLPSWSDVISQLTA